MNSCGRSTLLVSLFILLALPSFSSAFCPTATRNIYLAAVTGENTGGIFQLQVEVRPGNGTVYTAVSPRTGFATQESEAQAVEYAFSKAGVEQSECDVLFSMAGPFGENTVDGPSAGGAMTVATLAALTNRSIRQDVVMTGTISTEGKVGAVGGIIEKSLAASESGAVYIVVPKLQVYEALLLSSLSRTKNFRAIEVASVSDAADVLFSQYSQNFSSKFKPESKPVPASLKPIAMDADIGRFALVAQKVVDDLDVKTKGAFTGGPQTEESAALEKYFGNEIAKYHQLLSMGYPFTAANSAFLLSIDAEYATIGDTKVDLDGSFGEVAACTAGLKSPAKTKENFDWAVGSDLRRIWAKKKLNETIESRGAQGGYTSLRDLLFSYSWCGISRDLAAQADDVGGTPVNESALAHLAGEKLREAEDAIVSSAKPDYDAAWHLQNGIEANQSGYYGAAIYEATYAKVMQDAASGTGERNVSSAVERLAYGARQSLWGKIYAGQGKYLYAEAKDGKFAPNDAYRILTYSSELDKVSDEIRRELAPSEKPVPPPAEITQPEKAEPTQNDLLLFAFLGACVATLGIIVAWRLVCKHEMTIEKIFMK